MKFRLIKLSALCGNRVKVYSIILDGEQHTLFERFILENRSGYPEELKDINLQLKTIAHTTGIRDNFFDKPEGKLGQDIWALCDKPKKQLRLYCMQLGHVIVILGGGGPKPKSIRALQEDPKLKLENDLMRIVSDALTERMYDKEITWTPDKSDLTGNFVFGDEDLDEDE